MSLDPVREKLASLTLHNGVLSPSSSYESKPIFTVHELSREPLKWLKYLVMDRVGLESIDNVASQINRFNLLDLDNARNWVLSRFSSDNSTNRQQMVVVKVVPWNSGAQLKNYRVFNLAEVDKIFTQIAIDFPNVAHELWCCESPIGTQGLNAGGRLSYSESNYYQTLELVWYASPRLIESVKLPDFHLPYLRAYRDFILPNFKIEVIHVPKSYTCDDGNEPWFEDFRWIAQELDYRRVAMERLTNLLRQIGASEVCFCFKLMNERLTMIDWDTEIESTADNFYK